MCVGVFWLCHYIVDVTFYVILVVFHLPGWAVVTDEKYRSVSGRSCDNVRLGVERNLRCYSKWQCGSMGGVCCDYIPLNGRYLLWLQYRPVGGVPCVIINEHPVIRYTDGLHYYRALVTLLYHSYHAFPFVSLVNAIAALIEYNAIGAYNDVFVNSVWMLAWSKLYEFRTVIV